MKLRTEGPYLKVMLMGIPGMALHLPYEELRIIQDGLDRLEFQPGTTSMGGLDKDGKILWYNGVDLWGGPVRFNLGLVSVLCAMTEESMALIQEEAEESQRRHLVGGG